MSVDELSLSADAARDLLRAQLPELAGERLVQLQSPGTDNDMFRIGRHHVLRVPRRREAIALLSKELDWIPRLSPLPLEIPHPQWRGMVPGSDRTEFGVFRWIEGAPATPAALDDPIDAARRLAGFIDALHRKETAGGPKAGEANHRRGVALFDLDAVTRASIATLSDEIDASKATGMWEEACACAFRGRPVWLHGDLNAGNLVARDGDLVAVIDWGLAAVGDPAADHAAAWTWVLPRARPAFRETLGLEDEVWTRARGWAIYMAVIALAYYRGGRNEALSRQCRVTLERLDLMR